MARNIVSLGKGACRCALRASLQALFLGVALPISLVAAEPILFPTPLHLTREIHDPVSDSITVVEEYYHGSRVLSIRGDLTSIVDYQKSELTEIDRGRGVYSISRFDEMAGALEIGSTPAPLARVSESAGDESVRVFSAGSRQVGGRQAEAYRVEQADSTRGSRLDTLDSLSATIALDRAIFVSADAFDVITGAAYPNRRLPEHRMIAAAARHAAPVSAMSSKQQKQAYPLPLEQSITYLLDGEAMRFLSTVTRVAQELPPPDLMVIPRGARRVEGVWVQRARMYRQLIEQ
jgi:hypothetical protein